MLENLSDSEKSRLRYVFNCSYVPKFVLNVGRFDCTIYRKSKNQYNTFNFTLNGSDKRLSTKIHIVAFFLENNTVPKSINQIKYEISHLCHNRGCVNPLHLNLESKECNESRKHCKSKKKCDGSHSSTIATAAVSETVDTMPNCLL